MTVYLLNLTFIWIMAIMSVRFSNKKSDFYPGNRRPNLFFVFIALIPLILVCGLRWRVGTDYNNYVELYYLNSLGTFFEVINSSDPAFNLLQWLCSRVVYEPQIMFMACAIIITTTMVLSIRDYSTMFEMSMFLYIADLTYYSQFNGVRQWIASAIIFWAFRYLVEENKKKYFICIIIAATFHISAVFLIPIYYIVKLKPWSKPILLILTGVGIIFVVFPQVMDTMFSFFEGARYQIYLTPVQGDDGVNIWRVLVASVPLILSLVYHKEMKKDKRLCLLNNLCLLNFIFYFLAMRSTVIARMCFYFTPYNLLLIPEFIRMEKSKFKHLLYVLVMVCFLIYMIVLLPVDSNLLPYRTIFQRP